MINSYVIIMDKNNHFAYNIFFKVKMIELPIIFNINAQSIFLV